MSGHPSVGSPASSGGRITLEATNSSKRLRALRRGTRRDKLRDHAAMSRDRNTLTGLNPSNVAAQVVFEFADTCGSHH